MIGLVGKKVGMTRIFTEDGVSIPVTVIEAEANRVTQLKNRLTMATVPSSGDHWC
ncbi:hypothetical protein ACLK2E_18145 [Escherichia coli]